MVVAAGARHGQAQQTAGDHINAVIQDIVLIIQKPPAHRKETERRRRLRDLIERATSGKEA